MKGKHLTKTEKYWHCLPDVNNSVYIAGYLGPSTDKMVFMPSSINNNPVNMVRRLDDIPDLDFKNIKKLCVPEGVKTIFGRAFINCVNLEEIILPETLTKIGYEAFKNCTSLKTVRIPPLIEELKEGVFSGCDNLRILYLPETIKVINPSAIENLEVDFIYY